MGFSSLAPSVAVKFDTYENPNSPDLAEDHVALIRDGKLVNGILAGPNALGSNLEDGVFHDVTIEWFSDLSTMNVNLDGMIVLSSPLDMADILKTRFTYLGFSSSTGASKNRHDYLLAYKPRA